MRGYFDGIPVFEDLIRGAGRQFSFSAAERNLQNPATWSLLLASSAGRAWVNGTFHVLQIAGDWAYPRREHAPCGDWVDALYIVPEAALRRNLSALIYVDGMLAATVTPTERWLVHRVPTLEARAYVISLRWQLGARLQVPLPER